MNCTTGNVIVTVLEATDALIPGQSYQVVVNPAGTINPIVDRGGNAAATTEAVLRGADRGGTGERCDRLHWRSVASASAFGRSYAVDHLAGATASFDFKGKTVTWYTVMGPAQGKASVWIDGRPHGTFNQYAPSATFRVPRSFRQLAPGEHTITIRVLGQKGSKNAPDTQVAVDAIEAGGTILSNPELRHAWGRAKNAAASGGDVAVSDLAGTTATFDFYGTGVVWHTMRGPHQGRAQIFVDGALVKTVDNYASAPATATRTIAGLNLGSHELRIVVLGQARPAARGTQTSIDAFAVIA